jgi:hypothetical protein
MNAYHPAPDIYAVDFGHTIIVLRLNHDQLHAMPEEAATVWRTLECAHGDTDALTPAQQAILAELRHLGILRAGPPTPWPPRALIAAPRTRGSSLGTTDSAAALERLAATPLGLRLSAWLTLAAVTIAVRVLPLTTLIAAVQMACRIGRRQANPAQATLILQAIRAASGAVPGRAACLETSIGAVALLALRGRAVDWHLGVATDPVRFHAWIEPSNDQPEPIADYTPLLTASRNLNPRQLPPCGPPY